MVFHTQRVHTCNLNDHAKYDVGPCAVGALPNNHVPFSRSMRIKVDTCLCNTTRYTHRHTKQQYYTRSPPSLYYYIVTCFETPENYFTDWQTD